MSDWILKTSCQVRNVAEDAGNSVKTFIKGEEAPTAVEYGIMVALIAVAIITIVTTMGTSLTSVFTTTNTALQPAAGG